MKLEVRLAESKCAVLPIRRQRTSDRLPPTDCVLSCRSLRDTQCKAVCVPRLPLACRVRSGSAYILGLRVPCVYSCHVGVVPGRRELGGGFFPPVARGGVAARSRTSALYASNEFPNFRIKATSTLSHGRLRHDATITQPCDHSAGWGV